MAAVLLALALPSRFEDVGFAVGATRILERLVGLERIVIGSDYSFPPADDDPLATLRATRFSPRDIELIGEVNPRRLFPRLPGR